MKLKKKQLAEDAPRPPFRKWLAETIALYAQKKAFNEEREPRSESEEQELADIIRGIWQRCWILSYKPHPKQKLFHDAARISQVTASFARNQGGKTTAGEVQLLSWGFGEDLWTGRPIERVGKAKWRPGMRFFIGAQDYVNAHNETILPKMQELLPLEEIGVKFVKMQGRITHKLIFPEPYNFSIKLISYDQEEHKQEGPTWNGGWFDEPPPKGVWVATNHNCMKNAAPRLLTATPLREPWMYDDIYKAKGSVHIEDSEDLKKLRWSTPAIIKIGRNDNPHITEEQLKAFEDSLDEEERASRIYGEFRHLEGRVYKGFFNAKPHNVNCPASGVGWCASCQRETGHVVDRDEWFKANPNWKEWPGFCVIDPHDRKPWAMVWGVVTPRDQEVYLAEWPNFDFAKQKSWKWSIDEYVDMIRTTESNLWGTNDPGAAAGLKDRGEPNVAWRIMDPNFGRAQKAGSGATVEDAMADRGLAFDTNNYFLKLAQLVMIYQQ
jgi:phage terminase large subunit-like protein